jgi:zinc protease
LAKTERADLGYAIDGLFYGIPDHNSYVKNTVSKLTRDQVNAAIRRHLHVDCLQIVAASANAEELKKQLIGPGPTPIQYNSQKPRDILDEDKVVEKFDIGLRPQDIEIMPVDAIFQLGACIPSPLLISWLSCWSISLP